MRIGWLFVYIILTSCNSRYTADQSALPADTLGMSHRLVSMPDSVVNYIHAALDTMQQGSVRKAFVDWPQVRKATFQKAKGAVTYQQTYPALQAALQALGDHHSFLITPEQHRQWAGKGDSSARKPDFAEAMMLDNQFALLRVYTFNSGDPKQIESYALDLQAKIKELDAQNPLGWIIDLTYNSGGNMWPMLAGIGPLAGERVLGSFLAADGTRTPWSYEEGEVKAGNELILKILNPYRVKNQQAPIALLVSERTASSGEAILVSFMGRPNTRIIGTPTAGLSTANQNISLVDGAQLILTTAVFADRRGKTYGRQIVPDVDLSDKWYFVFGFYHHVMKREAKDWILRMNENRKIK
jgi:carboxyl-terminal processing protease